MSELTHINCVALTARFPVGKPVVPAALMNRPTRGERRFAYWFEDLIPAGGGGKATLCLKISDVTLHKIKIYHHEQ